MTTLHILVKNDDLALAAMPLFVGQFIESETPQDDGTLLVAVDMADHDDTSAAQEQYLDTNPSVIRYEVKV